MTSRNYTIAFDGEDSGKGVYTMVSEDQVGSIVQMNLGAGLVKVVITPSLGSWDRGIRPADSNTASQEDA